MANMKTLSESIIAVANENGYRITNLHLQKIMYFTLIDGLRQDVINKKFIKEIYDEKFEAWGYGPVIPSLYFLYKHYGANFIIEDSVFDKTFSCLKDIILDLLQVDVFDLVYESHKHSLWNDNKIIIKNMMAKTNIYYEIDDLINGAFNNG